MSDQGRIPAIDLIKWIAIVTMVIDHVGYLKAGLDWLVIVGRIAFPLFAVVMAFHVHNGNEAALGQKAYRYLKHLLVFAVLSQPVYMLYFGKLQANIFATLLLGLALAYGYRYSHAILAVAILAVTFMFHNYIGYGVAGVLLPTLCVWAMERTSRIAWAAPAVLAAIANIPTFEVGLAVKMLSGETLSSVLSLDAQLIVAAAACTFGIWLSKQSISFSVPKVTHWAYMFYPGHLAVLQLLRIVV